MLQDLRNRANAALGNICNENALHPHVNNYASNLRFFTDVVTRLENHFERAHQLVEERIRSLLGHVFSHVFSHLQNTNPDFDFDTVIAPVPEAIRGDLARWVEDNVDALVRAFASDNDGVVVAVDGSDVVNGGGGGANDGDGDASDNDSGASDASGDDQEGAVSDMSDWSRVSLLFILHTKAWVRPQRL